MALSEPAEYGQPDFILVDEISEEAFLANLKLRYEKGRVSRARAQVRSGTDMEEASAEGLPT